MAIATSDIEYRYSGGSGNTSAAASLGGAMSTVAGGLIPDATAENLFDNVSGDESAAGDIEYRGFYVQNQHDTLTWRAVKFWISSLTSSAGTEFDVALGDEAVGTALETIANESTAPSGPVFTRPTTKAGGLTIGDIAPNSFKGLWIKRTVSAGAAAASDSGTLRCEGDTDA